MQSGELQVENVNVSAYIIKGLIRRIRENGWRYQNLISLPVRPEPGAVYPRVRQGEKALWAAQAIAAPDLLAEIDAFDFIKSCCKALSVYQIILARLARYTWNEIAAHLNVTTSAARWEFRRFSARYRRRMAQLSSQ